VVEADRRRLHEENDSLKKRLGAVENILRSGTNDRTKFMEGASWIAKKSQVEAERTSNKISQISRELATRTQESCRNPKLHDFDGVKVQENSKWVAQTLLQEAAECNERFDHLY